MCIKTSMKRLIKVELILSILFLLTPILLFQIQGGILPSISDFAYSDTKLSYIILLNLCGFFYIIDGLNSRLRRYNILLGICLMCVTVFQPIEHRWVHNVVAIIFFLGNSFIVTYHSDVISRQMKLSIILIIIVTLSLHFFNYINLFTTESVGLFIVSFFMFMRFLRILRIN